MPKKFTDAGEASITKASQDLHRYEKICEEHSAVLRRDVEEYIKAHQEYTANSPPMGFMPPRDEFDHYIEVSEKVLKTECRTLLEQVAYKYEVIVLIYYLFVATFMWYALGSFLPGS